jgi:large subunit ribosomal protein L10
MSKPVKALLRKELVRRLAGVDSLAVVSLVGVDGVASNRLRRELRTKNIKVTVVKNSVARMALKELGLDPAASLIEGPCALAFGGDSVVGVVRELLGKIKDVPTLLVKGALMEGEVFPAERVLELSKYPTRDEAIAGVLMLSQAPASRLAGAILGPSGVLAGILKTLEERAAKNAPPETPPEAAAAPAESVPAPSAPAEPEKPAGTPAESVPAPSAPAAPTASAPAEPEKPAAEQ